MRKALVPATVLIALLLAPGALAARHRAHRVHHVCKQGYVERSRRVRRHRGHKTAYVRVTTCVKRPVKHKAASTTQPPALAPAPVVKLHAHLDPTFTRDPSDPFKVTYAYSASATATMSAALATTTEPAPLPEGVLNLYNDGLLACSINVGGETTGGQCPIEYKALGEHKVTTVYASGATSATETSVEKVEPFSGSVSLAVSYIPDEHSTEAGRIEAGRLDICTREEKGSCVASETKEWTAWGIGTVSVEGHADTEYGAAPGGVSLGCGAPPIDEVPCAPGIVGATGRFPVCVLSPSSEPSNIRRVLLSACPQGAEPWKISIWPEALESGAYVVYGRDIEAGAGYTIAPSRVDLQFKPEVKP